MKNFQLKINKLDVYTKIFFILLFFFILFQFTVYNNIKFYFPEGITGSEDAYHQPAINIIKYKIYGLIHQNEIIPLTTRPPLYSVFLSFIYSIFGEERFIGIIFNNLFLILSIIIIFYAGKKISSITGLTASFLVMLDSVYLEQANILQSDIFFLFCLSCFLLFFLKLVIDKYSLKNLLIVIFLMLCATFTRSHGMYLWIAVCITLCFLKDITKKQKIVSIFIVIFIYLLSTNLWKYRNYKISGNYIWSSVVVTHLVNFFVSEIYQEEYHISNKDADIILKKKYKNILNWNEEEKNNNYSVTAGQTKFAVKLAFETVKEYPISSFKSMLKNIPELYLGTPPTIYSSFFSHNKLATWKTLIENPPEIYAKNYLSRFYDRYVSFFDNNFYFVPLLLVLNKFIIILAITLAIIKSFHVFKTKNSKEKIIIIALVSYIIDLTIVGTLSAEGRFRMPIMPAMYFLAMMFLFNNNKLKNL